MITKEMRMRLLESMRDEEEGNQRQFLLNFLIMRKVNIEFLALHQAFEKESFELLQDILESAQELTERVPYEALVTTEFAEKAAKK